MLNPTILVNILERDPIHIRDVVSLKSIAYRNLRELRKDLKNQLTRAHDGEVCVARSKRGQWGEWFERWKLSGGEPRLVDEGWQ